ncbi:MAG: hypothetical protein CMN03_07730 [Roseibacillus sp.]|nr:hypothetical protein [Roseibacillus sp.]
MNLLTPSRLQAATIASGLLLFGLAPLPAQTVDQTITLQEGWNAVWLEVSPVSAAGLPKTAEEVFGPEETITNVLSPKPLYGTAEVFAASPEATDALFNQAEWEQWSKSEDGEDSGEEDWMVTGNRAYLIEASENRSITIPGEVTFHPPTWVPDRYNLIGFGLSGSPSFQQFFGSAGNTHPVTSNAFGYRLVSTTGQWVAISPGDEMISNEAYWIFASGPSNYMGPVSVDFDGASSGTLAFGGPDDVVEVGTGQSALELDLEEITFTVVAGDSPNLPVLDLITSDDNSEALTLQVVTPQPTTLGYNPGNLIDTSPGATTAPSAIFDTPLTNDPATTHLTLGANRDWESGNVGRTNIYRLSTGQSGASFWLPVSATLSSLELAADLRSDDVTSLAGLWVGEVSLSAVTSLVEDGAPVRDATAPAPLQILLHSNREGDVNLLSQVTVMQTRTADASLPSEPVLVVDPAQIPFFEGIKKRNGKRVGVRLESVAFDMPRTLADDTQADLLDVIEATAASNTTTWSDATSHADIDRNDLNAIAAAVDSYLTFTSGRPSSLQEAYDLQLSLDGNLGEGKTVRTRSGTLILDQFHRSNPFRHAFHKKHAKGPKITRELSLVFDSTQSISDRLTGTYNEEISGLTKSTLTLTGDLILQRVSSVDRLQGAPSP